jgi:tetratricopeptide (TPR) repeat protein
MKLNRTLFFLTIFLVRTALVLAQTSPIDSLQSALKTAVQNNNRLVEANTLRELATAQANEGSVFEALKNAQRAKELFEAIGKPMEAFKVTSTIIIVHQQLHNADKMLEYAVPALAYARSINDSILIARTLNAVGAGYDEKKEKQKTIDCYLEQIKIEEALGEPTATAHLNVSITYAEIGNYTEGVRHADLAVQKSQVEGDTAVLAYTYAAQSFVLLKSGRVTEADKALSKASALGATFEDMNFKRGFLRIKPLISAAKGDYKQAFQQQLEFYEIDSTLASQERNAQFGELEAIYETKKKEEQNARLNERVNRQTLWIGGILSTALLLGTIVWLQRKRLKINAQLLETEKALVEAERLRLAEETAFHQTSLDNFTQSLLEKNSIIEALKTEMSVERTPSVKTAYSIEEKDNMLSQLTQATILTEEQWRNFRQKFERVHDGFFQKFGQTVPDATESEYRLAALTKLEMTNNEIASMLGISPDSVIKTRYRLRKKLGNEDLLSIVQTL